MKSHHQSVQISFINEFELLWIILCDLCKYRGVQLHFHFAVYVTVALLFAFISCCVYGRTGEFSAPNISFSVF